MLLLCCGPAVGCEQRESADLPPGLVVLEDYVSQEEEASLLQAVDWAEHDNVTGVFLVMPFYKSK